MIEFNVSDMKQVLAHPASLVVNVYLFAPLTFMYLLRGQTFRWTTQGRNVFSSWGNCCKTELWANHLCCIEVLLLIHAWKWISPRWVLFFSLIWRLLNLPGPDCLFCPSFTRLPRRWMTYKITMHCPPVPQIKYIQTQIICNSKRVLKDI